MRDRLNSFELKNYFNKFYVETYLKNLECEILHLLKSAHEETKDQEMNDLWLKYSDFISKRWGKIKTNGKKMKKP